MPSKAACCVLVVTLFFCNYCVTGLIIPEELPTILSVIYSNIPPIKKGTDSRLGVGFRLGEHADFQIVMELGPQKDTDSIGLTSADTKRKRAVMMSAAMRGEYGPWAQAVAKYQIEQKIKKVLEKYKFSVEKSLKQNSNETTDKQSEGSDWLLKWRQGLTNNTDETSRIELGQKSIIQKILPNINRMRVVNNPTKSDSSNKSAQNDLDVLKTLFKKNDDDTKSAK